jgi:UDP:flavonoid glycosyltransferase YjiC (YdhE family)
MIRTYCTFVHAQTNSARCTQAIKHQRNQPDWPANTVLCGFARYDGANDVAAAHDLEAFLAAGEAPIVFALGSSAVHIAGADEFWRHAVAASRCLGRRAILLTGRPPATDLPAGIRAFQYQPYSLVFPRAAAVVHQAGVGTLAQALAAGHPQLIVPVAFDQPDNARRAQRLGGAARGEKHARFFDNSVKAWSRRTAEVSVNASTSSERLIARKKTGARP